jgi:hypothetical protein
MDAQSRRLRFPIAGRRKSNPDTNAYCDSCRYRDCNADGDRDTHSNCDSNTY